MKKEKISFEKSIPKLVQKIRPIKELMQSTEEGQTLTRIRKELEDVASKIREADRQTNQSEQPDDAQKILSGISANELSSLPPSNPVAQDLQRQRRALKTAEERASTEYRIKEIDVTNDEVARLKPDSDPFIVDVIEKLEALRESLENLKDLSEFLWQKGYRQECLGGLILFPLERCILYGPPSSIRELVDLRKKQFQEGRQ